MSRIGRPIARKAALGAGLLVFAAAFATLISPREARADSSQDLPLPPLTPLPPLVAAGALPDHWGVVSATTDAPGHDVFSVEFGFPGISFGYTHGISDNADFGVKVDVLYGVLYTTNTQFGMAARLPLRMIVAQKNKLTLLAHIDPGLFVYAGTNDGSNSLFGLLVPVGAAVGYQPISNVRVSFGIDLPLAIQFLHSPDFFIGPQFGFTAETFVDSELSIGVNLRFGPMFIPTQSSDAQLGFVAQCSVGYRL